MNDRESIAMLVEKLLGKQNVVPVPTVLIRALGGDPATAIVCAQCAYWSGIAKEIREDEWFWKTYPTWQLETGLSEYQVRRAVNKLTALGFLETVRRKKNGAPTLHYRFDTEEFGQWLVSQIESEVSKDSDSHTEETKDSNLNKPKIPYTETTHRDSPTPTGVDAKKASGILVGQLAKAIGDAPPPLTQARKARYGREFKEALLAGTSVEVLREAVHRIAQRWPDFQLSIEQAVRDLQKRTNGYREKGRVGEEGDRKEGYEWLFTSSDDPESPEEKWRRYQAEQQEGEG